MVRSFRRGRYVVAFLLTLAVFIIGLLLGFFVSDQRSSSITDVSRSQRLDYDSLQLQYLYISSFVQQKNCDAALKALDKSLSDLENTRLKLESYISTPFGGNREFELLKREYILGEVRYWLFLRQTEDICKKDSVSMLYFYSNEECPDCGTQGMILTYLKDKFRERLLVFALDYDFAEEPMLGILRDSYNVTSVPTIVIRDRKFEGLKTKEELTSLMCSYYQSPPDACSQQTI